MCLVHSPTSKPSQERVNTLCGATTRVHGAEGNGRMSLCSALDVVGSKLTVQRPIISEGLVMCPTNGLYWVKERVSPTRVQIASCEPSAGASQGESPVAAVLQAVNASRLCSNVLTVRVPLMMLLLCLLGHTERHGIYSGWLRDSRQCSRFTRVRPLGPKRRLWSSGVVGPLATATQPTCSDHVPCPPG